MRRFDTDEKCRDYLVKTLWGGKPRCPQCGFSTNIYTSTTRPMYKCRDCGTQFRVTSGTIFENSKIPLQKWFLAIYMICSDKKGVSSIQLAKDLNIAQRNAWHMAHKIRKALLNSKIKELMYGIVEVDETYQGGKNRKFGAKRGRGTAKQPIFGLLKRDKDGKSMLHILPVNKVDRKTLQTIIMDNVKPGSVIMSDEWKAYYGLDKIYIHKVVSHGVKEYARMDGKLSVHVNGLEGAWSLMKRGFKGVYHKPMKKYLSLYCGEFEFKYNNKQHSLAIQFRKALSQTKVVVKHRDLTKTSN